MVTGRLAWLCIGLTGLVCPQAFAQTVPTARGKSVDYEREVRPILESRCSGCHGPVSQKSGLRVDQRESLLRGGDSGEAGVVPGDSAGSHLIRAVAGHDAALVMPPKGERLTVAQVGLLRAWVDQGAHMPATTAAAAPAQKRDLWSLKPPAPASPPKVDGPWGERPVDAFLRERLKSAGLEPSPPADPRTLVRRVYLVVLGLPPTPDEIDAFVNDHRPDAYERLVDAVLARPEYGERWAQHWLDVIRWAENWGYETNAERPDAWPYRDWVIRALNDDLPFDKFAFAQIAGDTTGDDAATALLVAGPANLPGQIGKDEPSMRQARHDELDEVVKTVSAAFLGLTVGCARCHDHKFDPISQRDYYAMEAVFAGLHYGNRRLRGPENDRWAAQARDAARALESLRQELEAKRVGLGLRPPVSPERQTDTFAPVLARAVRMNIKATNDGSRPSLFELELWGTPETPDGKAVAARNVGAAAAGGKPSASSFALENQTRHPDNLVDGLFSDGDRFPWIAKTPGPAWVQIDLAGPARVDRVVWQRGFEGFPVDYEVEVLRADGVWARVVHSRDRAVHEADRRPAAEVALDGVAPAKVAELVALAAKIRATDAEHTRLAAGPQVFAGTFGPAGPTYRLHRGDPMQRKEPITADIPAALGSLGLKPDSDETARRVALARWVASPSNPLTARVIANRVWQHVFGTGLVDTPSDFGRMGAAPSHPELLDWLAGELIRGGWSLKHLQRVLLTSRAFRQTSAPRPGPLSADAGSRLLWRFPPRRLEAEAIRDAILRASGSLNPQRGGPGFDLFNQKGGLSDYIPRESRDPSAWRRMVYATKVRMKPVDVFGAFDCPDAGQFAPKRPRSITPVQALGLLNSEFVNRQAGLFADRLLVEAGPKVNDQVARAFLRAFGRMPGPSEATPLENLASRFGTAQVCRVLFNANEFVFVP